MRLINTTARYGWPVIIIHWLSFAAIAGLFALGLWMVTLDYYHPWYRQGPDMHRSIGIVLMGLTVLRLVLRWAGPAPRPVAGVKSWEHRLARRLHGLFYALILALGISGYLISTADGRAIIVFDWFAVPAVMTTIPRQEEVAGMAHEYLAYTLIGLALLHMLAALKHHFIHRDDTLRRMLGLR